jgi:hypothetical protein
VIKHWFNKINFVGKIAKYLNRNSQLAKIISLIIIAIIIPLTVVGALSIQNYRQYASESCRLRGDANGDGEVDIADVIYVERVILGLSKETSESDANRDGEVNIVDVTYIERLILGQEGDPYVCTKDPEPPPANSSGSSGNSSGSSNNSPSCGDALPNGVPDLFQISVNSTTATLYYSPLGSNVTDYYIFYGDKPGASQFSVSTKQGRSSGVLSYSINYLNPNTTYYFKVRGQNGCAPGGWSNEMKMSTGSSESKGVIIYYKNGTVKSDVITNTSVVPTIVPTILVTIKPIITKSPTVTQSPHSSISPGVSSGIENLSNPSPEPEISLAPSPIPHKKTCFLWWCWY